MKVTPSNPRRASLLATTEQKQVFADWLKAAVESSGRPKKQIAREALGHGSAAYLNKVLNGVVLPRASTLRKIAEAASVPVYLAQVRAGYRGEIIPALAGLQRLGLVWCKQAGVAFQPLRGVVRASIIGMTGRVRGKPLKQYRKQLASSYFEAAILPVAENYTQISGLLILPRPTALALQLVVLGFPRRGDVVLPNAEESLERYLQSNRSLLKLQEQHRDQNQILKPLRQQSRVPMPRLLNEALLILKAEQIEPAVRLSIASEFVQAWADQVCPVYVANLRENVYSDIGVVGKTSDKDPVRLRKLRMALFPDAELPVKKGIP